MLKVGPLRTNERHVIVVESVEIHLRLELLDPRSSEALPLPAGLPVLLTSEGRLTNVRAETSEGGTVSFLAPVGMSAVALYIDFTGREWLDLDDCAIVPQANVDGLERRALVRMPSRWRSDEPAASRDETESSTHSGRFPTLRVGAQGSPNDPLVVRIDRDWGQCSLVFHYFDARSAKYEHVPRGAVVEVFGDWRMRPKDLLGGTTALGEGGRISVPLFSSGSSSSVFIRMKTPPGAVILLDEVDPLRKLTSAAQEPATATYPLPEVWLSRGQLASLVGPSASRASFESIVDGALEDRARTLHFNLEDYVLVTKSGVPLVFVHEHPLALFDHDFELIAPNPSRPYQSQVGSVAQNLFDGSTFKPSRRPRLIRRGRNFYDLLDARTTKGRVLGARAAVRNDHVVAREPRARLEGTWRAAADLHYFDDTDRFQPFSSKYPKGGVALVFVSLRTHVLPGKLRQLVPSIKVVEGLITDDIHLNTKGPSVALHSHTKRTSGDNSFVGRGDQDAKIDPRTIAQSIADAVNDPKNDCGEIASATISDTTVTLRPKAGHEIRISPPAGHGFEVTYEWEWKEKEERQEERERLRQLVRMETDFAAETWGSMDRKIAVRSTKQEHEIRFVFHFAVIERGLPHVKVYLWRVGNVRAFIGPYSITLDIDDDFEPKSAESDIEDGLSFCAGVLQHELGHILGLPDEYEERLKGRSVPKFSQRPLAKHFGWDRKSIMTANGPPRLRHYWAFSRWLVHEPGVPVEDGEYTLWCDTSAKGPQGREHRYALPASSPSPFVAWRSLDSRRHAGIGRVNLDLFLTGDDLDGVKGITAVDAVLLVTLKIHVRFRSNDEGQELSDHEQSVFLQDMFSGMRGLEMSGDRKGPMYSAVLNAAAPASPFARRNATRVLLNFAPRFSFQNPAASDLRLRVRPVSSVAASNVCEFRGERLAVTSRVTGSAILQYALDIEPRQLPALKVIAGRMNGIEINTTGPSVQLFSRTQRTSGDNSFVGRGEDDQHPEIDPRIIAQSIADAINDPRNSCREIASATVSGTTVTLRPARAGLDIQITSSRSTDIEVKNEWKTAIDPHDLQPIADWLGEQLDGQYRVERHDP